MKQVSGDFGRQQFKDNLPAVNKPLSVTRSYQTRNGMMGRMPDDYRGKSYMVFGRYDHEVLESYGQTMGWGFKLKMPKVKINVKKLINSIGKAFESMVDLVKETVAAARKVVLSITPPALHKYLDIVINPLPLITNPLSTIPKLLDPRPLIQVVTNPMAQINYVLDPEPKLAAVNYAYKNVLKPAYRMTMDTTAELALKPVNTALDATVYKVLPSSIVGKLEKLTDMPEQAARGKLTADVLREASMATLQLAVMPTAVGGYVANTVVNWARKDFLLGPVLNKFDSLSGGLLTSAQNLTNTGQEVYYDRDIDWKRKIIDGVMVYLAVTGATAFAQMLAAQYVGNQTGLNSTPIGRDVLLASRVYLTGAYNSEDMTFELSKQAAKDSGKAVLTGTAKRELIIEAAKKGIIDRKTLEDVVTYGTAVYGTKNPDGTYNSEALIDVSKDAAYQEFLREEVKRTTGLDLSLKDLAEIYGYAMNPQEILDNVNAAAEKAVKDRDNWEKNVENAYEKALDDYEDFNLSDFIKNEMPRFEQNVKDELSRFADGHVDDFVKWAIAKLGPEKAKDPRNFTMELLTEYQTSVLDLTGKPVPKKGTLNPMVFGAGVAIMAGAAFLIMED